MGKALLLSDVKGLIMSRAHRPIAIVYSSDSTPLRTKQRWLLEADGLLIVRRAKSSDDSLLQRFFIYDTTRDVRIVLTDPVLLEDKSSRSHFSAQRLHFPLPRAMGHRARCLHHHVWGGAARSSCERRALQLHEAHHVHMSSMVDEADVVLLQRLSWATSSLCILHSKHNSLKWAIHEFASDRSLTKDVWIVCESLVNSMTVLAEHFNGWAERHIAYQSGESLHDLLVLLGMTGEWLDLLCDLQLRRPHGRLCIAGHLEGQPGTMDKVRTAFMYLLRIRSFSASSLCGISETSRCLVGGLLVHSEFRQRRRQVLSAEVRPVVPSHQRTGCGSLCAGPVTDSALGLLQVDDRLVRVASLVEEEIELGLRYTANLPECVVGNIASTLGLSATQLRNSAMQAGSVQAAHIRSALREVHEHPWNLATGNIEDNLKR